MADTGTTPRIPFNASDEHRFYELGPRRFELLAKSLHEARPGIVGANLYAPDSRQFGADHIAYRKIDGVSTVEVGQSKAERNFTAGKIGKAADEFLKHWDTRWRAMHVTTFILFVGSIVKSQQACDAIIAQRARFAEYGVEFILWGADAIYERLPTAPYAVRHYLDLAWYEHIFGKAAGPLAGLAAELDQGWNLGVVRVQAVITRLDQAESAEIEELRRRIRRGEGARVADELEVMLFQSPVAGIVSASVRAGKLRLLAAQLLRTAPEQRILDLLSEADSLDGGSARLRAILLLETIGPDAVLANGIDTADPDIAEVQAVALLRLGRADEAVGLLDGFVEQNKPRTEILRLAAIASLAAGDRTRAVTLAARAIAADPEARACQQTLGICLFNRALSPALPVMIGEWPQPVDQPMVASTQAAQEDLVRAEAIFAGLAADPALEDHQAAVMWQFGVLACMPARRGEAEARLAALQGAGTLPIPLIAWAMSRALPFDRAEAIVQCDARLAAEPDDAEALFIRVALAHVTGKSAHARSLLAQRKDALIAAGHGDIHDYWVTLLALSTRAPPSSEALAAHPWLRLRAALDTRGRTPRLAAIAALLDDQLAGPTDPRITLAATQLLLEGGWHKRARCAAPYLVEQVATAEAIGTAAHAYYRNHEARAVLDALARPDLFPQGQLPVDLERLRAECLAASGAVVEAREASLILARQTRDPLDIWRSIDLALVVGERHEAVALYQAHADILAKPASGHLRLAQSITTSHPDLARGLVQQVTPDAPDNLVTTVFTLAARLKMAAEQDLLAGRIQALGKANKGGVQLVSIDDIRAMVDARHEQSERAYELFANGHAPIHILRALGAGNLAETHLAAPLEPPGGSGIAPLVLAHYGRRFEEDIWPADRTQVRLAADLTALLTAHGLGLRERIERAFAPILIPLDTIHAIATLRAEIEPPAIEEAAALVAVIDRLDTDGLGVAAGDAACAAASVVVLIEAGSDMPPATLTMSRLFDTAACELDPQRREMARDLLVEVLEAPAQGTLPPDGAALRLPAGLATLLAAAGMLEPLCTRYHLLLEPDEVAQLRGQLAEIERRRRLVAALDTLSAAVRDGIADKTYQLSPSGSAEEGDLVRRGFMQILEAAPAASAIAWIDDRYVTSIDNASLPVASTLEVIEALMHYNRMTEAEAQAARQRLRGANWQFFALRGEEIVAYLRAATAQGEVRETGDLAILRRSIGHVLIHRRRLQWPDAAAAAAGLRGEVPFLLDSGHGVSEALAVIWGDPRWTLEDAAAASRWIIETLEIGLFPMSVMAPNDPRGDHLIGIHLGGLVLTGIRLIGPKPSEARQSAFLEWIWKALVTNLVHARPGVRAGMEQLISTHLADGDAPDDNERLWRAIGARFLNALPLPLRIPLLDHPALRATFNLTGGGQITIESFDFDESGFYDAALAAGEQPVGLTAISGEAATLHFVDSGEDAHLRMNIAGQRFRLSPWPRDIASEDMAVRRVALGERAHELDLGDAELDALNTDLGPLDPRDRIRETMRRTQGAMAQWYLDLQTRIEARRPFAPGEFAADDLAKALRHLRLADDLDAACAQLIAERGLAVALRRFGGLPIVAPPVLRAAVAALDEAGLDALLDAAGIDTAPPWVQLVLAEMLGTRILSDAQVVRIRSWFDTALSVEAEEVWRLYLSLAQFLTREAAGNPAWSELTARQQLAYGWSHASALTEILVHSQLRIEPIITALDNHRRPSPRFLIEPLYAFDGDTAAPGHVSFDRLRVHAAGPALFALREDAEQREWAEAHLQQLLRVENEPGHLLPRMEIARGALAQQDLLGSYLAVELAERFNTIAPGAQGLFRGGLATMLALLLAHEPGSTEFRAVWTLLRQGSADAPLPDELATLAKARGELRDLADERDGLTEARYELLTYASLASLNDWRDARERIATAAFALGPRDGEEDLMVLFEIAVLLARLEEDAADRVRVLASELSRLGAYAALREQAIVASRHFAQGLPGTHADPFIDVLGTLLADA